VIHECSRERSLRQSGVWISTSLPIGSRVGRGDSCRCVQARIASSRLAFMRLAVISGSTSRMFCRPNCQKFLYPDRSIFRNNRSFLRMQKVVSREDGESIPRAPAEGIHPRSGCADRPTPPTRHGHRCRMPLSILAGHHRAPAVAPSGSSWQLFAARQGRSRSRPSAPAGGRSAAPRAAERRERGSGPRRDRVPKAPASTTGAVPLLTECFRFAKMNGHRRENLAISERKSLQYRGKQLTDFLKIFRRRGGATIEPGGRPRPVRARRQGADAPARQGHRSRKPLSIIAGPTMQELIGDFGPVDRALGFPGHQGRLAMS
jgi:hypothetical protein